VRILADENIGQMVIERLREAGHTVISLRVESAGASDLPILERAVRENLLLLTADLDFGEYIYRDHLQAPAAGVVQLRLSDSLKEAEKTRIIADVFAIHEASFAGKFSVMDQDRVRFRALP
jgi:predicted nuclease of predicted toxin-antitoxin system